MPTSPFKQLRGWRSSRYSNSKTIKAFRYHMGLPIFGRNDDPNGRNNRPQKNQGNDASRGKTRLTSDDGEDGGESGLDDNTGFQTSNKNFGFNGGDDGSDKNDSGNDSQNNNSNNDKNSNGSNNGNNRASGNTNNPSSSNSGDNTQGNGTTPSPSSTSTSDPSSATSQPKFPPPCLTCIADNDARVRYSGPWTLSSNGFFTTHSTTTPGSSLSLVFNGTGIVVFGTVPPSNSSHPPPSASYTIDTDPPFATAEPLAAKEIPFQPLFKISSLSAEEHLLVINVTSAGAPYIIDSFFVVPPDNSSAPQLAGTKYALSSSSSPAATATSSAVSSTPSSGPGPSNSLRTIHTVAGVLSGLIVLLLMIFTFVLVRRRRRRKQGNISGTTWFDKYMRKNLDRETTIFTSTESIMQNMPSSLWSTYSRSERPSVADFFVPSIQSPPPPLPPKPRSHLSLPIPGAEHLR